MHAAVLGPRGRALDASPDGRWILVATPRASDAANQDYDLFAVHLDAGSRVAIDTVTGRSVTEALWSPDGSRIAWVARVGEERQQEAFIAFANGTGAENVTRHPADDYHVAWSGDGDLLGFTSMRDGNAELYAFSVHERRLWRLTRDPAQDDWARFAPSGRLVAFESTRGGESGVYIMASLGGEPVRVGAGLSIAVLDWRGGSRRYLDRLRLDATVAGTEDTISIHVAGVDQFGNAMDVADADVDLVDGDRASLVTGVDSTTRLLIGRSAGLVRLVASAGGWRVDTAIIRVGTAPIVLADGPSSPEKWRSLGDPRPVNAGNRVLLNGDGDGESGLLSRDVIPVLPGLELVVDFAGVDSFALNRTSLNVAMVAPEQAGVIDSLAPQFLRHISATWDGDARRMIFAVGREVHSELVPMSASGGSLRFRMRVEPDSTVSFHVGGAPRWRSTVRAIDGRSARRAQAWIGGRSTGALQVERARLAFARVSSP
jgi:dipeptidyl aminopeptidase/acylaminoacyl peptidase